MNQNPDTTLLYITEEYSTIQYCREHYNTVVHSLVQYNTERATHYTIQNSISQVQYNSELHNIV